MKIGLLALQGAFREHHDAVCALGVQTVYVRRPEHLEGCDGLIIPGGESTAISKLLDSSGLREPIKQAHAAGMALFGTCAGAILLASTVEGAVSGLTPLALMDATIKRNGYGRQVDSFETIVPFEGVSGGEVNAVFIRAPRFDTLGTDVEVLSRHEGEPIAVRQGSVLAVAFHPELTEDRRVHQYFIETMLDTK